MGKKPVKTKVISISKTAADPSAHVIDARKLLTPWIDVQGVGPKNNKPVTPRPAGSIKLSQKNKKEKEQKHPEGVFDILWHIVRLPLTKKIYRSTIVKQKRPAKQWPTLSFPKFSWPKRKQKTKPVQDTGLLLAPEPEVIHVISMRRAVLSFCLVGALLIFPFQTLQSNSLFKTKGDLEKQLATIQTELSQGADPLSLTPNLFALMSTFDQAKEQLGAGENLIRLAAFAPIPLGALQTNAALFEAALAISNTVDTLHQTLNSMPADAPTSMKAAHVLAAVDRVQPDIQNINKSLKKINSKDLPESIAPHLPSIITLLDAVDTDLSTITASTKALLTLLGTERPSRFLVLFQNDAELRATGGFIGSFGILDIADGKIKKFEVPSQGSYAVQGQLTAYLQAPGPMHVINTRWEFQDSNWFPDFPTSAQTSMRLYELSHGATVDGVIAFNTQILKGFLDILGPVENPINNEKLSSATAAKSIRDSITKRKGTTDPKAVLTALTPIITEGLESLPPTQALAFAKLFNDARNRKDMLIYSSDPAVQQQLASLSWDGSMSKETTPDYLQVVHSNIGGGKTDELMHERVLQRVTINEDGKIHKQVTIARTHTGELTDSINRDYLRVYTPSGSTLISANGFDIIEETNFNAPETWYDKHPILEEIEQSTRFDKNSGVATHQAFNKTVFGGWVLTAPGQTSIIELEYELENPLFSKQKTSSFFPKQPSFTYALSAVRQPGVRNTELLTTVQLPDGWEPVWLGDDKLELGKDTIIHRTQLHTDELIGFVASQ